MTEPDGATPGEPDEPSFKLGEALRAFKAGVARADTGRVSDTSARPLLNWDPVTDDHGAEATTEPTAESPGPDRSSFQFDLGGALARLGNPATDTPPPTRPAPEPAVEEEPAGPPSARTARNEPVAAPADPLPVRTPKALPITAPEPAPLPVRGRADQPAPEPPAPEPPAAAPDPLPVRGRSEAPTSPTRAPEPTAAPPVEPVHTAPQTTVRPSVFADASPAPHLPSTPSAAPAPAGAGVPPVFPTETPGLPSLPASMPAAPPPMAMPVDNAPSTPDLNALRSAKLRASRNERRGKMFGRSLLAFIVLGGLVAAALLFGRSYLFPTEWDARLTPIVDEIQLARGADFPAEVPLVEHPSAEYGTLVTNAVLGEDWLTRLPEWRALGIAGGDGAPADVAMRFARIYPAFYDPATETIHLSDDAAGAAVEPALRLALEQAYATQTERAVPPTPAFGLTGLDDVPNIARRAVDAQLVGLSGAAPGATADLDGLPLPIVYELRAIDALGAPLVAGAGDIDVLAPLPDSVELLDDGAALAIAGLRQPGDQQILEPVALGADDWAMIWGARLPTPTAFALANSITADSYTVVNRAGATCVVAVFQTRDELAASTLTTNLGAWVASAPPTAQATVSQLGTSRVQLEACDPGSAAAVTPAVDPVDLLLARQLDRIAG